jgi:hypothetical protein
MSRADWKELKSKREEKQLELFKKYFVEVKDVGINLEENDPPDGSLILNSRRISIELTELYWDNDSEGVNKKAQESLSGQIITIAQKKYENLNLPPAHVGVSFKDNYGKYWPYRSDNNLNSLDKEKLSEHIVQKIIEYFPASDSGCIEVNEFNNNLERLLDPKLSSISITRYPKAIGNCWFTGSGGSIPEITFEIIANCISKKSNILKRYGSLYDNNWLVIVERWNNMSGWFEFADEVITSKYKFDFDKVFILRCWEGEVIELKKAE